MISTITANEQLTLSGRGLLGFEPIRRGFGGLGVALQRHAEQEGWFQFGVFTAQQGIPARLLMGQNTSVYWSQKAQGSNTFGISKFHTFPYANVQTSLRFFFFREYATLE